MYLFDLESKSIRNVQKVHLVLTLKCIYIKFEFEYMKTQPSRFLFNPSRLNRIPKYSKLDAFIASKQTNKAKKKLIKSVKKVKEIFNFLFDFNILN